MKRIIILPVIVLFVLSTFNFLSAQEDREQKPGMAKKSNNIMLQLKGQVRNKSTGQLVPNADITVKELSQQKIINKTNSGTDGNYEVDVPKGVDIEIKAQAPELFYDAFKVRISTEDTTAELTHDFELSSELQLRLNFPSNKHNDPYPYVLDDGGNPSDQFWQNALEQVAEDLVKYKDYLEKVILTGHTDDVGKERYNKELGEKRVGFVMEELVKRGVDADIIEIKSVGKSELLEKKPDEDKESWRKRCRRVVLSKIMKKTN